MSKRLHYIDWLRVLAVLLLFPFHTWRVFNANEAFYVKSAFLSQTVNSILWFIDFWHMPLLFLLAGASTYFALRKRTGLQYAAERFTRLGVPLIFGWAVLIPPQTWYGGRFNSGYAGSFLHYITSGDWLVMNLRDGGDYFGGFGLGHLWFILFLLIIALMALPLLLWWRSARGERRAQSFSRFLGKAWAWPIVGFILMIAEGLPSPDPDRSIFYFMALFVFGYAIMADGAYLEAAKRYRWPAIIVGAGTVVLRMMVWKWHDSLADPSVMLTLANTVTLTAVWLIITGLLGFGQLHLDQPSKPLSYLAEASYPLYILHQTVIVVAAFYLVRLPGPWIVQWVALLVVAVAVTFGLYEVVRRVGVLRFLFGMRRKPAATPTPVTE